MEWLLSLKEWAGVIAAPISIYLFARKLWEERAVWDAEFTAIRNGEPTQKVTITNLSTKPLIIKHYDFYWDGNPEKIVHSSDWEVGRLTILPASHLEINMVFGELTAYRNRRTLHLRLHRPGKRPMDKLIWRSN